MDEELVKGIYLKIKMYRNKSIKFFSVCIALVIAFFVIMGILISIHASTFAVVLFGVFAAAAIGLMVYFYRVNMNDKTALKNKILNYFLSSRKDKHEVILYFPVGSMKNDFINSNIYNGYNNLFFTEQVNIGNGFKIANALATVRTDESRVIKFDGIFVAKKIDEFYENEIIIKPDFENKYVSSVVISKDKLLGNDSQKVYLESAEFEKYFEVCSKNQIKAREIVTPKYMEDLLNIKLKLGVPIKVIYKGNMKYIAIWNKKILDDKSIFRRNLDLKALKEEFDYIIEACENII